MGSSHPSRAERMAMLPSGAPGWFLPKGVKGPYDFPRAKLGEPTNYEFNVSDRQPGRPRRLDKVLMERFEGFSRSFLQKMIKDGRVLINGHTVKSSWHVRPDETITVILMPRTKHLGEDIPFDVIYEDEFMLAVGKPAGIVVHPARGNKTGTLYNGILKRYHDRREADPSMHIGCVHRLDEETSGVIVFALDKKAHAGLTQQFEFRKLKKTYLCIAHGLPDFDEKEIDAALGVDPADKTRVVIDGLESRPAQTLFKCLGHSPRGAYSLIRAFPHTGRSHQIRVHALALGHQLVGDELYSGRKYDEAFGNFVPRVCLHAETLELTHPIHKTPMTLKAPLPPDLKELLGRLELKYVAD